MSTVYPHTREALLRGGVNLDTATVRACLVNSPLYTYDATHEFFDDVAEAARVADTEATVASIALGVVELEALTFASVPAGLDAHHLVLYLQGGTEATSRLLVDIDAFADGLALLIEPTGADIFLSFFGAAFRV